MKKTLVLLSALAIVAGGAFAAETYTGSLVDKYTSGVVQKEANLRKNIADKQKAQENKAVQLDKKIQAKQNEVNKKVQAKQDEINKKVQEKQKAQEAKNNKKRCACSNSHTAKTKFWLTGKKKKLNLFK